VKTGVIYQEGKVPGEVKISWAVMILKLIAQVMSTTGLLLIIISVFGLVFVYIPLGIAEANYAFSKTQLAILVRNAEKQAWERKLADENQKLKLAGKPEITGLPSEWAVPDVNYSIYIPKINAISKVIPGVDAGDQKIYLAALKQGVAEASGLSHPGETGTTFLFAHSVGSRVDFARYNAVFYLLDKLTAGDRIEIVYQGKWYKYEVADREILDANDTKYLIPQTLSEKLVLQTCYPPGTSWRRLVVVANRI
jgi:LPXTG-site transpeptidase (sortase) family protein